MVGSPGVGRSRFLGCLRKSIRVVARVRFAVRVTRLGEQGVGFRVQGSMIGKL